MAGTISLYFINTNSFVGAEKNVCDKEFFSHDITQTFALLFMRSIHTPSTSVGFGVSCVGGCEQSCGRKQILWKIVSL
jgi:hypothetical protein